MKKHIMVIDDDRDELSLFLDALKGVNTQDGFKCTYAGSGTHAIEMLKFLVPDYIFVDYNMPAMNGIDFLQHIHDKPVMQHTKLFLYSTYIDDQTRNAASKLGAAGCLKKENSILSLTKMLSSIFVSSLQPAYIFSAARN
jgi:CheY-like chemotaxis protein